MQLAILTFTGGLCVFSSFIRYFYLIFSQGQPTYDWDPKSAWDTDSAWGAAPTSGTTNQYQVEQQYNMSTNNTRSVINKPVSGTTAASGVGSTSTSTSGTVGSTMFVSDPLAFPSWDD